jgi:hypothetical protein
MSATVATSNLNKLHPLAGAFGASKNKTSDFINIKNRVIMQREPSKR